MGFLDKFKQERNIDSGLDLPETDSPIDNSGSAVDEGGVSPPDNEADTISSDPSFGASHPNPDGDGLRQDVKLVLEKLDTVKSQLQHVQSRLDTLEAEHGSTDRRR